MLPAICERTDVICFYDNYFYVESVATLSHAGRHVFHFDNVDITARDFPTECKVSIIIAALIRVILSQQTNVRKIFFGRNVSSFQQQAFMKNWVQNFYRYSLNRAQNADKSFLSKIAFRRYTVCNKIINRSGNITKCTEKFAKIEISIKSKTLCWTIVP